MAGALPTGLYQVTLSAGLADLAANARLEPTVWTFETGSSLGIESVSPRDDIAVPGGSFPSVTVKFPALSDFGERFPFLKGKKVYVLIWTTTPWTLPANLAIAFHQKTKAEVIAAELRPGQVDPFDYEKISPELERLVQSNQSNEALARSEYKRWQMGVILRVSLKAFGSGRLIPITRR